METEITSPISPEQTEGTTGKEEKNIKTNKEINECQNEGEEEQERKEDDAEEEQERNKDDAEEGQEEQERKEDDDEEQQENEEVQNRKKEKENEKNSLKQKVKDLKKCEICGFITTKNRCLYCADPTRDDSKIMVVSNPQDAEAVEKTLKYNGLYHILGGLISSTNGIFPSDLNIDSLIKRSYKSSEYLW